MNKDHLPIEQQSPELVQKLEELYQMSTDDQASLARIEGRFARTVAQHSAQQQATPSTLSQHKTITPLPTSRTRARSPFRQYATLAATVLMILALTATTIVAFGLMGKNRPGTGAHLTPTVAATSTATTPQSNTTPRFVNKGVTLSHFSGLYMLSDTVGWSLPGKTIDKLNRYNTGPLFRTTDGARTWQKITLPDNLEKQQFEVVVFDADAVFALPLTNGNSFQSLSYYRSVDAGKTWERLNWPTIPVIAQDGYANFDVSFLDAQHGWVIVSRVTCCGAIFPGQPGPEKALFKTEDGGKNWQKVGTFSFKNYTSGLFFSDQRTGWLTNYDPGESVNSTIVGEKYTLFVTHDGGTSWQAQSLPEPQGDHGSLSSLSSVEFVDARQGYLFARYRSSASTERQYLYATTDGGKTWQLSSTDVPLTALNVIDATHVYQSSDPNILYTLTNGKWVATSKTPPTTDVKVTPAPGGKPSDVSIQVRFFNARQGIALIAGTYIYKTEDGGQNWRKVGTLPSTS